MALQVLGLVCSFFDKVFSDLNEEITKLILDHFTTDALGNLASTCQPT